jgi:signal transduction histidine kinase
LDIKLLREHGICCFDSFQGYSDQIAFEFHAEEDVHYRADKFWLNTLFGNIVENAVEYRKPQKNSFFSVKIEVSKEAVQIYFKDNGIGVPSELGNKVFDMFVIGTEESVGAGLGLYEAKVIVEEKMDGRIWFKNYGGEEPTEIEIILPLWG